MILLIISFIAGVLTVLAPCILPLLPVIVGGSASTPQEKWRPYIITGSLLASVIIFTLALKWSTVFIDIPPTFWKWFSGGIIIALGLSMIYPGLWEKIPFTRNAYRKSNVLLATGYQKKSFFGDVIMGLALGPVFTSCSPTYFIILATVLPASFTLGLLYLASYAFGLSLILLIISLLGQRIVDKISPASDPEGKVKKIFGVIFLVVGISIIFGLDKQLQTFLIEKDIFDITKVEQILLQRSDTNI